MTKEERRALMPLVTAFVDDMRKAFGNDAIIYIKAVENGFSVEWRRHDS